MIRVTYKAKGQKALIKLTDQIADAKLIEMKRLRQTLISWQNEILNYFSGRITNLLIEGSNHLVKLLQKRTFILITGFICSIYKMTKDWKIFHHRMSRTIYL